MFANLPTSPTNIPRPSNLHAHHPDMKPMNSSNFAAKSSSRHLAKAGSLAVALAVAIVPPAQAGHLLMDFVSPISPTAFGSGGFAAPTATLNMTNNNLIFRQATGLTLANATSLLFSGEYSGPNGYWDGKGINSSSAANDPNQQSTIGYLDNSQFGYTSFNTVNGYFGFDPGILNGANTDILVKTTWYGDATLDGFTTLDDYSQWQAGFSGAAPVTWLNGDFNGDGAVTLDDYSLWAAAFAFTGSGATGYTSLADTSKPPGALVPEPGSLGLLAVGVMGILGSRRKRIVGNVPN